MDLDPMTIRDIFEQISDLARDQGVADKHTWDELVEDVIETHLSQGGLYMDQDIDGLKTNMSDMWEEYERENDLEANGKIQDQ